jgi:Pyruvate/2-oxoacid:ferredoxin oxidoreductase delta subunit
MIVAEQKKNHWGQVVPIEEVEQILDMAVNIVRLPCACRSATRGLYDARYCFGVTTFKGGIGHITNEYPDWTTDLEELTTGEAKKAIQKLDRNGLVHTIWTFITPYIGGVCNCTATDCLAMKGRLRSGLPIAFPFFKAEHVAVIDLEDCSGCRDCLKNCNFGAISYSPSLHKCYINQFQCYGCGVCRAVCSKDAITLRDRNAIPALAKEW